MRSVKRINAATVILGTLVVVTSAIYVGNWQAMLRYAPVEEPVCGDGVCTAEENQIMLCPSCMPGSSPERCRCVKQCEQDCGSKSGKELTKYSVEISGPQLATTGETIVYTFIVENKGSVTVQRAKVRANIPTHLTFNAQLSDSRCTQINDLIVECGEPDLLPNSEGGYRIAFDIPNDFPCNGVIGLNGKAWAQNVDSIPTNVVNTKVECVSECYGDTCDEDDSGNDDPCGNGICEPGEMSFTPDYCPADCEDEIHECRQLSEGIEDVFESVRSCNTDEECVIWTESPFESWACTPYNKKDTEKLRYITGVHAESGCPSSDAGLLCDDLIPVCVNARCETVRENICGNGVCEVGERGQCDQDCGRICLTVLCAAPPDGCRYVDPKHDGECQTSCGELKCDEGPCAPYECADGSRPPRCSDDGHPINVNPCPKESDDEDNEEEEEEIVLCEGQYKPGETYKAADGCNTCTCTENGLSACTKMACPVLPPPLEDGQCYSSQDCYEDEICTVELGECHSPCAPGVPCDDVCMGACIEKTEPEDEVITNDDNVENHFDDTSLETLEGIAANTLAERNIIGGFPDGTFRGDRPVNRAEAAKFLMISRYITVPDASNNGQFRDVREGEWYVKYIMKAASLGVIKGYNDGTFRPAETVNTAEFLKMISETFDLDLGSGHRFTDVPSGAWFAPYATVAETYSMFPGRPTGKLQPDRLLTRGEVAIAIYRLLQNR